MLAADDADLAARDHHLPGLRLVLDGDAVTEALAAAVPQLTVTHATPAYVRYKPGTSCLVAYRLGLADGARLDAVVRTYADASHAKLAKVLATAPPQADGTSLAAILDPRTVCTLAPHDPELPALSRLAVPGTRAALLARALDADPVDGWTLTRLRYNPGRRWVGRLAHHDHPALLVKVHRPAAARRAADNARALATTGVPIAPLRGLSRRHGVTVHEWVEGVCAADLDPGARPLGEVGQLLARLHAIGDPRVVARLAPAPPDAAELSAAVGAIRALDPAAGRLAASTAAELRLDDLADTDGRVIHGDCSLDQVVLTGRGPVLIDLDRAAVGDPTSDLAQLLADAAARGTAAPRTDPHLAAALLDGYATAGGTVDRGRLARLAAARLLRLAPEPFRRRSPHWSAQLHRMIRCAAEAAGERAAA